MRLAEKIVRAVKTSGNLFFKPSSLPHTYTEGSERRDREQDTVSVKEKEKSDKYKGEKTHQHAGREGKIEQVAIVPRRRIIG